MERLWYKVSVQRAHNITATSTPNKCRMDHTQCTHSRLNKYVPGHIVVLRGTVDEGRGEGVLEFLFWTTGVHRIFGSCRFIAHTKANAVNNNNNEKRTLPHRTESFIHVHRIRPWSGYVRVCVCVRWVYLM